MNDEFEMKDLDEAKRIGGMNIMRRRKKSELFLSKSSQLKKMVERIRIQDAKTANTPLGYHMKLSVKQYSQTK